MVDPQKDPKHRLHDLRIRADELNRYQTILLELVLRNRSKLTEIRTELRSNREYMRFLKDKLADVRNDKKD
jgi:hypothetical protein